MITVEPFQPWHIDCIDAQESQDNLVDSKAVSLAQHEAWTARIDGRIVACGGIVPIWQGRAMMWSQLSKTISPKGMVLLTRSVKRFIKISDCRLEAFVVDGHDAGHRWIKMLGFTMDTPNAMKNILPNGEDAFLYSRLN